MRHNTVIQARRRLCFCSPPSMDARHWCATPTKMQPPLTCHPRLTCHPTPPLLMCHPSPYIVHGDGGIEVPLGQISSSLCSPMFWKMNAFAMCDGYLLIITVPSAAKRNIQRQMQKSRGRFSEIPLLGYLVLSRRLLVKTRSHTKCMDALWAHYTKLQDAVWGLWAWFAWNTFFPKCWEHSRVRKCLILPIHQAIKQLQFCAQI